MHSTEIEEWLEQSRGQPRTDGITAVDLLGLPEILNHVMRLLFAHAPVTESQLRAAVTGAPEAPQLEDEQLHRALDALCEQRWLLRAETPDAASEPVYTVNFRTATREKRAARNWQVLDFES